MRGKRLSLSNEIMGIETTKRMAQKLDYEKILHRQQEVIKLLQKEISYLRQYVFYVADYEEISEQTATAQREDNPAGGQGEQ